MPRSHLWSPSRVCSYWTMMARGSCARWALHGARVLRRMRSIVLWVRSYISMSLPSVLIQSHYSWLYLFLQYYDDSFPTLKEQTKFEESLFNKTRRSNGMYLVILVCMISLSLYHHLCFLWADEIIMHEGVTAVYKSNVDLFFCVLGAQNENEARHNIILIYNHIAQ